MHDLTPIEQQLDIEGYIEEKKEITVEDLADEERQLCEVWTRVMGYHRPISEFNKGKQSEAKERKYFKEPNVEQLKRKEKKCS